MFCAGCGQMVANDRAVCLKCGRPVQSAPPRAGEAAELYQFGRAIFRLQRYWFLFACLNVALGVTGLVMAHLGLLSRVGPWEPWPHPPLLEWTYLGTSAWSLVILRAALAAVASIGLRDRAGWARLVTGMAAVLAFTQFPIGLLLGAYTMVKLLGTHNAELFRKFVVRKS
jgi:hypothetical protein